MPPSLKDRGGRLQAFARQNSESNDDQKINGGQGQVFGGVLEQPQPVSSVTARQVVDESKGPLRRHTGTPRQVNGFGQPPARSPRPPSSYSPNGRPRPSSEDGRGDLFSGSQLGEGFMNSGLTTPQNEPVESVELNEELPRGLMHHIPSRQLPDRDGGNFPRPSEVPSFAIGTDGTLAVVQKPLSHNVAHIGDGFRDDIINGFRKANGQHESDRIRPGSPLRAESKLPMREVRIRRSHAGKSEVFNIHEQNPRSSTPPAQRPRWNTQVERGKRPGSVHGDDDDVDSLGPDEHTTPKPKKPHSVTQRQPIQFSLPTFTVAGKDASQKRRRPSPEYDDMALSSMTFTELKKQPFDFDPSKEEEKPLGTNSDNLVARLNQFRHLGEKEQHALFANMSLQDWESSGEWFVSEFASFVQALTEARRDKRRIVQEFEDEAADREEAVRLKSEAIDRKLSKMKQDGQRVVGDRGL